MDPSDRTANTPAEKLRAALAQASANGRLEAALAAGTYPDPAFVDPLVDRCGMEPDFTVREMLTWALVRHPADLVLSRLRGELVSPNPQARSQGLHTLSKIGDPETRRWITGDHLHDADDEVARAAWRTAAGLAVDDAERSLLAGELLGELGRGGFDVRRSLSRAIVELGEGVEDPLRRFGSHPDAAVRAHAEATLRLLEDPESSFFVD